jgi:hypothetical protein
MKKLLTSSILLSFCVFAHGYSIKFTNNSGLSDKVIYVQVVTAGDGSWNFETEGWDYSCPKPASSITLDKIPGGIQLADFASGGRVYISIGGPSAAHCTNKGKQYYAPMYQNPWTENYVFDKIEMGGATGAIINQSAVDIFALPLQFEVEGEGAGGIIASSSRAKIMSDMIVAFGTSQWKELLCKKGDNVVAVLNPAAADGTQFPSFGVNGTVLKEAIEGSIPANSTLYIVNANVSNETTKCKTDAYRNITIGGYDLPFTRFTTAAVFNNHPQTEITSDNNNYFGVFSAYILRGVSFKKNDQKVFSDYKSFPYTNDPFARVIHKNGIDQKGYAMGYDDSGAIDFSSSVPRNGKGFTITINDCSDLEEILGLKEEGTL